MTMRKIVALIALMLAGLAITNAAPNGVSVEIALDQTQFLPGEDVNVAVRITNLSGREIELGSDNQWLTFYLQGEGGHVVPRTSDLDVAKTFTIASAKIATRRVNITPAFNFT